MDKKDFLKQKKTVKKLIILSGFLAMILIHLVLFYVILGKHLSFAYAAETVRFRQEITPFNPIEKTEPAEEEEEESDEADLKNSDYRIIVAIQDPAQAEREKLIEKQKRNNRLTSPIIFFSGTVLYPNSEVFLEIHSEGFFSSTFSDSRGNWTWTNYGQPLENGEHSIEAYNFSPFEISGKRDVFTQKYYFTVEADKNIGRPANLSLNESYYQESPGDNDLGDRLMEKTAGNTYLFNAVLLNKKEFNPGDKLDMQLIFTPLGSGSPAEAKINYSLYAYEWNSSLSKEEEKLISQFSDKILLDNGGSFLKRIDLQNRVISGKYLLKVVPQIGQDKYVQAVTFNTVDRPVIQIGGTVITEEKFSKTVIFDISFILLLFIATIFIVILEYKRFLSYRPIDENVLREKGFLISN